MKCGRLWIILQQLKGIKQFVCIGLCAGATAAAQMLAADHRVKKGHFDRSAGSGKSDRPNLWPNPSTIKSMRCLTRVVGSNFFRCNQAIVLFLTALWIEIKAKLRINHLRGGELSEITIELNKFFRSLRTRGVQLFIVYSEDNIGKEVF